MEATLQALLALLIKSIPTILIFSFLIIYLQVTYFGPVAKVLKERREKTEGVKELAKQAFESADKRKSEFERALQIARGEINQRWEQVRREWAAEQAKAVDEGRHRAEAKIATAKAAIADDVERAKLEMDMNVEELSTSIVEALVRRRAA